MFVGFQDVPCCKLISATRQLGNNHEDKLFSVYEFLLPYIKGNFPGQRVVAAAVFAEMINFTQVSSTPAFTLRKKTFGYVKEACRIALLLGVTFS